METEDPPPNLLPDVTVAVVENSPAVESENQPQRTPVTYDEVWNFLQPSEEVRFLPGALTVGQISSWLFKSEAGKFWNRVRRGFLARYPVICWETRSQAKPGLTQKKKKKKKKNERKVGKIVWVVTCKDKFCFAFSYSHKNEALPSLPLLSFYFFFDKTQPNQKLETKIEDYKQKKIWSLLPRRKLKMQKMK